MSLDTVFRKEAPFPAVPCYRDFMPFVGTSHRDCPVPTTIIIKNGRRCAKRNCDFFFKKKMFALFIYGAWAMGSRRLIRCRCGRRPKGHVDIRWTHPDTFLSPEAV